MTIRTALAKAKKGNMSFLPCSGRSVGPCRFSAAGAPPEQRGKAPSICLCPLRLMVAGPAHVGFIGHPRRVEVHQTLDVLLSNQGSLGRIDEEAVGLPLAGGVVDVWVEGVELLEITAGDVLRQDLVCQERQGQRNGGRGRQRGR